MIESQFYIYFLAKQRPRIAINIISILTGVLKFVPENYKVVHEVFVTPKPSNKENKLMVNMLKHSNNLLRERMCQFIFYLSYNSLETLESLWSADIKDTLEALVYDTTESVRNVSYLLYYFVYKLNIFISSDGRTSG